MHATLAHTLIERVNAQSFLFSAFLSQKPFRPHYQRVIISGPKLQQVSIIIRDNHFVGLHLPVDAITDLSQVHAYSDLCSLIYSTIHTYQP